MKLIVNPDSINWENNESYYLFDSKHPQALKWKKLAKKLPFLKSHIYLFTSGYSKICILPKKAFLFSASLANKNLKATHKDKWLISLPLSHVSGLSILARSFLSSSTYFKYKGAWDPYKFTEQVKKKNITLSSLVPAQVYDLVIQDLKAPKSLRAILVGGDYLSPFLYKEARKRNWPLLICYGATETASHIACSSPSSLNKKSLPQMKVYKGIQIQKVSGKKDFFKIKSLGLFHAYFDLESKKLVDPKDRKAWFVLPDRLSLKSDRCLSVKNLWAVKISGESVNLEKNKELLQKISQKLRLKCQLLLLPDLKRGFHLALLSEEYSFKKEFVLAREFNKKVPFYEKIQGIYWLDQSLNPSLFKSKRALLV